MLIINFVPMCEECSNRKLKYTTNSFFYKDTVGRCGQNWKVWFQDRHLYLCRLLTCVSDAHLSQGAVRIDWEDFKEVFDECMYAARQGYYE